MHSDYFTHLSGEARRETHQFSGLVQHAGEMNVIALLEYQQNGEDIEHEALESETDLGAVTQHLLGRVVFRHLAKGLFGRDASVWIFPDELAVVEPCRTAVRAVEGDESLLVSEICRTYKA